MKIEVIGSPDDVRGFALAGLPGRVAESPAEAEAALADSDAGLLLISAAAARLAPEAVARLEQGLGAPVALVLPEGLSQ